VQLEQSAANDKESKMEEDLLYSTADGVATITLNRPAKMNAFSTAMINRWVDSLVSARQDDSVHVIIVTGAGKAFCAGGDLNELGKSGVSGIDHKAFIWEHIHRIPLTLETIDKPVIAMVNGVATRSYRTLSLQPTLMTSRDASPKDRRSRSG
jgi:enoyl-CoA hydratase/carnithine racemase